LAYCPFDKAIRKAFVLAVHRYFEGKIFPKEEDVTVKGGPCRYDCFWDKERGVSVLAFAYPRKDNASFIYIAVVKSGNVTRYPCASYNPQ